MLQLTIPETELWDEKNEMFVYVKEHTLQLEHSLVSLSKWESKWKKPFIGSQKSDEETVDYIRCMTITQHVDPNVYRCLRQKDYAEINDYISDSYTATTFPKSEKNGRNSEIVTSELIYFWMISFGIPFECQKWNLNKLFALIKVCDIKNRKPKKQSAGDIMRTNAALNAARKKQLGTNG